MHKFIILDIDNHSSDWTDFCQINMNLFSTAKHPSRLLRKGTVILRIHMNKKHLNYQQ